MSTEDVTAPTSVPDRIPGGTIRTDNFFVNVNDLIILALIEDGASFVRFFVNADAIVRYIQSKNPELVTLVPMGYEGIRQTDEDEFCADYIATRLNGDNPDFNAMVEALRTGDGARLLDPANHEFSPARDFDLCLDLNRFNFVLRVNREKSPFFLERIDC